MTVQAYLYNEFEATEPWINAQPFALVKLDHV